MVAPGKTGHPFQLLGQRLYHNLLGIVDVVNHQPELPVAGLQDHDIDRLGPGLPGGNMQFAVEINQRQ